MNLPEDMFLTREQAAANLTAIGLPVAANTLRTMATRGGGPAYRRFGRVTVYKWSDCLAWAESKLTAPRRSTSEADADRSAA